MSPRGGHNVLIAPPPSWVFHYYHYTERDGRMTHCGIRANPNWWYYQTTEYKAIKEYDRSLCGNCKRTRRAR